MIQYNKDDFDSNIFNKNVYKLFLKQEIDTEDILFISDNIPDIVFCFSIFSNRNIRILEDLGFRFISIRTSYHLEFKEKVVPKKEKNITIKEFGESGESVSKDDIRQLSDIIGKKSRYFKDPDVPRQIGKRIYFEWLNNSLFKGYADTVFLLYKKKEIAGLVSLKKQKEKGYIDLIGVKDNFQNKGFGTLLVGKAISTFIDYGINDIYVITEGENLQANYFYQKNGFRIQNVELVYHKHYD